MSLSHIPLARNIKTYLVQDSYNDGDGLYRNMTFPKRFIRVIALELVIAIDEGKMLRLGSLYGVPIGTALYSAILI